MGVLERSLIGGAKDCGRNDDGERDGRKRAGKGHQALSTDLVYSLLLEWASL